MAVIINGTNGVEAQTGGFLADSTYGGSYTDGTVVDYTSGLGRISVGGSDGLAFYRGGIANTESMRIDSSGNVGIGISSTSQRLHLYPNGTTVDCNQRIEASSGTSKYVDIGTGGSGHYLYGYGNYAMYFGTNGSERMRIDSSGNVGIGTSSPAFPLDVRNSNLNVAKFQQTGSFQPAYMTSTTNLSGVMSETGNQNGLLMNSASNYTTLWTGGAERMRIDSSGNLLVGTTSTLAGAKFSCYQNNASTSWAAFFQAQNTYGCVGITNTSGTAGYTAIGFYNNGTTFTQVGYIGVNSSSTSYVTSSDYRLKENIAPMTGALDKVALLKPVTYTWKVDGTLADGFIAHELAEVCPQAVSGEKDAVDDNGNPVYQGIDTSFLVATLTKAIQEQQDIINNLKSRIEALESK